MVLSANVSIDSIRKYLNNNNISDVFYNLVEAFYYSVLRERGGMVVHILAPSQV